MNGMEGFILAAGLGTRLLPRTADRPKALVEVGGQTLLERTIHTLEAAGVEHIVVNVHHFADMMVDYIGSRQWRARIDISDERRLLLDTGGGLKQAATLFSGREPVLVHNVDILSDVDLRAVERQHVASGNLVTLCVSRRQTKRMLLFDGGGLLRGRADGSAVEGCESLAFSGISVVSPALFDLLPAADRAYPAIDQYVELARSGRRIGSFLHPVDGLMERKHYWLDVGKTETLELAEQLWRVS